MPEPKTRESLRKAIRTYKEKHDKVQFDVRLGGREDIKQVAIEKGFPSMQAYLKALIEKDSGLTL